MNQSDTLRAVIDNLPVFFCAAEMESGKILMVNRAAEVLFGDVGGIGEIGGGNALLPTAGDNVEGRLEYSSNINGRRFWISHYPVVWREGVRAEVFVGIDYGRLKRFSGALEADDFRENLTGPVNAVGWLEKQISAYKSGKFNLFTVCFFDVDGVGAINDELGEREGDAYINTIIKVVKSSIRKSDIFIHIGGDDFLVVFPRCVYSAAENILASIVKRLEVFNIDNELDYNYSISYGIMEVSEDAHANVDLIMSTIHQRMKEMKERAMAKAFG